MQQTISITDRWQIHIPTAARKALKLKQPGRVEVKTEGNKIILTPVKSAILKLAGKYAKYARGKNINLDRIRNYIDYSDL